MAVLGYRTGDVVDIFDEVKGLRSGRLYQVQSFDISIPVVQGLSLGAPCAPIGQRFPSLDPLSLELIARHSTWVPQLQAIMAPATATPSLPTYSGGESPMVGDVVGFGGDSEYIVAEVDEYGLLRLQVPGAGIMTVLYSPERLNLISRGTAESEPTIKFERPKPLDVKRRISWTRDFR